MERQVCLMPVNEHTARALQTALDRMHGTDHARGGAETATEMRARLQREESEATRRSGVLRNPFGPRVTPENINEVIDSTQRDLARAKADAANSSYSPSARANARQRIEDHKRRLDRLHQLKPIAEAHAEVVRSNTPEARAKLQKLQDALARSDAKTREGGKTVMNVVTKSATVSPVESESPNGEFEAILSNEVLDRDDEQLWVSEWKQPLPAKIHIDGDHGRSLDKTVGSAVPTLDGNQIIAKGTYAGTPYAQMVRQLVNEGHINSLSVTYAEHKNQKDGGIQRELLNAAFVAIPANPEAVVLASKTAKLDKTDKAEGDAPVAKHDEMVQAIHDATCHLGAECRNTADADPGEDEGANKSIAEQIKAGLMTQDEVRKHLDLVETSSSKDAGTPQESTEESAAAEPAEKSAGSAAAEDSADDAVIKERLTLSGRALEFLTKKSLREE